MAPVTHTSHTLDAACARGRSRVDVRILAVVLLVLREVETLAEATSHSMPRFSVWVA